ncbi:hypothetical protein X975_23492, partial [Stegodyphus mimosarum]
MYNTGSSIRLKFQRLEYHQKVEFTLKFFPTLKNKRIHKAICIAPRWV